MAKQPRAQKFHSAAILLLSATVILFIFVTLLGQEAQEEEQGSQGTAGSTAAIPPTSATPPSNDTESRESEVPKPSVAAESSVTETPAQALERATDEANSSQTRWYRSNHLGMPLAPLDDPHDIDREEWGLEIETSSQQQLKSLYFRGGLVETWLLTYRNGKPFQEQHKKGDRLLERKFFDEDSGRLSEISMYPTDTKGGEERRLFFYGENGDLRQSILYDETGSIAREILYTLDGVGHLVKLKIAMPQTARQLVQYRLPKLDTFTRTFTSKEEQPGKYKIQFFNNLQQNTSQIVYLGDTVAKRTNFQYTAEGSLAQTIVTEPNKVTQFDYDSLEKLIQKQIWEGDTLSETELYHYDVLGRLDNKKTIHWKNNQRAEERYQYRRQTHNLQKIEFYIAGEVDKIRTYQSLYSYVEKIYLDGVAVAKVYYSYGDELYDEVTFENAPAPDNGEPEENLEQDDEAVTQHKG